MKDMKNANYVKWKLVDEKETEAFNNELSKMETELLRLEYKLYPTEPDELITDVPSKVAEKLS